MTVILEFKSWSTRMNDAYTRVAALLEHFEILQIL